MLWRSLSAATDRVVWIALAPTAANASRSRASSALRRLPAPGSCAAIKHSVLRCHERSEAQQGSSTSNRSVSQGIRQFARDLRVWGDDLAGSPQRNRFPPGPGASLHACDRVRRRQRPPRVAASSASRIAIQGTSTIARPRFAINSSMCDSSMSPSRARAISVLASSRRTARSSSDRRDSACV